jgi:hypothetical protein
MSDFQTAVNYTQPNGVPGEIAYGIPTNVQALTVTSVTADNVFGRVFTRTGDNTCEVGGTGEFAGILVHSKEVAAGTVEAGVNFALPQYGVGSFLTSGAVRVVFKTNQGDIGDALKYDTTTGEIVPIPWGEAPGAGFALIRNAKVDYYTAAANTVGTIKIVGV